MTRYRKEINPTQVENLKGLRILLCNARSILGKFELFRKDILALNFDIMCVSETWLKPDIESSYYEYLGYKLLRVDRNLRNEFGHFTAGGG